MNTILTQEIIKHIFFNLGITNNNNVSLKNNNYLLNEKLSFIIDNGKIVNNNIWGCQFDINQQTLKILLGDSSLYKKELEYCAIIHLSGSPTYGLYLSLNNEFDDAMIAYSLNGNEWLQCNTYLQATFLAAMEQIKDVFITQQPLLNFKEEYQSMLNFVKYHSEVCEEDYEG
jgi:hypothetical protein